MIYFVRPAAAPATYGTEDGSSYENAFNGFSSITGVIAGDTVYICGTHTETWAVNFVGLAATPVLVYGNYPTDPGVIDSEDTRAEGIQVNNKDYITFNSLSSIDATSSCIKIYGTSTGIVTTDCTFSGSGNQGIQHEDTASATHNNPTCTGNTDDGISGHDSATIVVNGATISNNDQGVNVVQSVTCTLSGSLTFSNNTTFDIWAAAATTEQTASISVTGATLPGDVQASSRALVTLINCTCQGAVNVATTADTGYLVASGCTFAGSASFGADALATITNSIFSGTCAVGAGAELNLTQCVVNTWSGQLNGDLNLSKCTILDDNEISGNYTAEYCLYEGGADDMVDFQSGSTAVLKYCIFDEMAAGKFGIACRSGSDVTIVNCNLVGSSQVGRGIYTNTNLTIYNCILTDLEIPYYNNSGVSVMYNSLMYDNENDPTGIVVQHDTVTGDPKLVQVSANNFSPRDDSAARESGYDAGSTYNMGIASAVWGDGTAYPVVTTESQPDSWTIGADIGYHHIHDIQLTFTLDGDINVILKL